MKLSLTEKFLPPQDEKIISHNMYNQENLHPLEDKLKTENEAKFLACVI